MCRNLLTLAKSLMDKITGRKRLHDRSSSSAHLSNIHDSWNNKNWSALSKNSMSDISSLSNRGEVAFMIAIAHAELGAQEEYIAFSDLALTWNLSPTSMKRMVGECYEKRHTPTFKANLLNHPKIGIGWATNTVNTAIYRHHGILTVGSYQYTAFYASDAVLTVVRMSGESVERYDLPGQYRLHDAHNSISLGYDRDHCLHITYDHHGTKLKYRRSSTPYAIDTWRDEQSMTGLYEDRVTYPTFINPRLEHPLTLLYRDGDSEKGSARLKTFDEKLGIWSDHTAAVLSGENNHPWTCNGYWNHPAIGKDGALHLSFVWRTHSIGSDRLVNNLNICYAKSFDNGLTWQTSTGIDYRSPITPVNSEVIIAVPPGSNLMNQCSMALDGHGYPHIAYYANDNMGIPQYFHLWQTASGWRVRQVSNRKEPFQLKGIGTLQIPISRPEIILDQEDNVHILFRGDISENRLAAYSAAAPRYLASMDDFEMLWPADLGYAEPVIDRTLWNNDNILTLFIQRTGQPNGDVATDALVSPINIVTITLTKQTN